VGSGFRTFTAGEVLTASNVQNYLMDQSVMVFGGSAARSSAIGTANFEEGMVSYLTDTDKVEAYNGTNWVSVAPTTSQGLTLINTTSFSAVASQSINDVFSATYENYKILINTTNSNANGSIAMRMRVSGADNTNNEYTRMRLYFDTSNTSAADNGSGGTSSFLVGNLQTTSGSQTSIELSSPFLTERTKHVTLANQTLNGFILSGTTTVTTSYTGFTILPITAVSMTGTVSVYGYNK
jgi:hypothetical protein